MNVEHSTIQNFYLPGTWYQVLVLMLTGIPTPFIGAHIPFWFNVVDFLRGREVLYVR